MPSSAERCTLERLQIADALGCDPAEAPHRYPTGIPHVVVNGAPVIEQGEFTGQTPGKVIRGFED
ncbi:MAG: hypothetical protein ACREOH_12765 [Candidatus Entotheonellia bacterium]